MGNLVKYAGYFIALMSSVFLFKKYRHLLGLGPSDAQKMQSAHRVASQVIQSRGFGSIIDPAQVASDAAEIIEALGVDYSWYNPYGWTEDEERVLVILGNYNPSTAGILVSTYDSAYSRSLQRDCVRYLNTSQYESVRHLF